MSLNPAGKDTDKLREFERRLSREGAAAFADGPAPWESWDDALPLRDRPTHKRHTPPPDSRRESRRPQGQGVITGIALFSVLALVTGIAGIYFSSGEQPQLADTASEPLPIARTAPQTDALAPWAETDTGHYRMALEPDTLPAPAAGNPELAAAAAGGEQPPDAASETRTVPTGPAADAPGGAGAAAQQAVPEAAVETLAAVEQPAAVPAPDSPQQAAQKTAMHSAATQAASGDWVVNLASYRRESVARRMLGEFRDKGVTAELVTVTVNDAPMIRVRTTGHASYREARDWAALLEERLELEGVWVSKR